MAKFRVRYVIDFFIEGESADYVKGYASGICNPYMINIIKTAGMVDVFTESGVESVQGLTEEEAAKYPFVSYSDETGSEEPSEDFDPLDLLDDDQEVQ
jgi:hypothetical protein